MKLFISQPMRDKTEEEIFLEREKTISLVKEMVNEDIEVLDSYIQETPEDAKPLWYIGKSLEILSGADAIYFTTGWQAFRGCRMEHIAAMEYGIKILGQ